MRNKLRLAAVTLALPLLLLAGVGAIADPATPSGEGSADSAAQSKPKQPNQKKPPAPGEQAPADSFTPSETISADSAVSFPVDI